MAAATAKLPPALKHGAYSTATLLPGEDEAAFDRLHQGLITELGPEGTLEEHIVANMARFVWRREHLDILQTAQHAHRRVSAMLDERITAHFKSSVPSQEDVLRAAEKAQARAEVGQARAEVGELYELAEILTEERLASEIELRARLDEMIDKCLKRLLFLRGLKSMGRPAPAARIAHVPAEEVPMTGHAAAETVHAVG